MDSSETQASAHSERKEDPSPSTSNTTSQEGDGPKSHKATVKRKSREPKNGKTKKQKKARVSRPARLGYTVHQGEDMLLVISSTTSQYDGSAWMPPKKGSKKKKLAKGKLKANQVKKKKAVHPKPKAKPTNNPVTKTEEDTALPQKTDYRWGQSLPEEVLINIFQMVVVQDGAVPFLCRVGRVCRLWNAAASSPVLWRKVTVGFCWIAPGRSQLPKTQKKIKETINWLAQDRSVLLVLSRGLTSTMRNSADSPSGFPLLEELCIATTSYSYMTDKDLRDILFGSTKLRVLDLRGCSRITPSGLATLPCRELECLFWGQYFSSHIGSSPKKGLHMVTQKWSQTLQQLDIANQLFSEEDLEIAMSYLAQATETDTLRSLNLSGTRITPPALRSVIGQMTALSYLNLSSCRYLPRGLKRIYRGQEDIRQLLDKLE
uniref:F-box domain-containing protein n=1 Tax=Echeneis naucrates TaxID=173247 RepID=A0A665TFV5_ECHNA